MKARILKYCVFILALFAMLVAIALPVRAESDTVIHVYIYHDYYVPYMPGADNCYGVYRIIGSRGYQEISELAVSRHVQRGKLPGSEGIKIPANTDYVGQYHDTRTLYRDDVFLFTAFQITAGPFEEIIYSGRYVYHHIKTYYFEAPYSVAGYMADFSPITGSNAYTSTGRPWLIAADTDTIKRYMPSYTPIMITPNFPGAAALSKVSYRSWKTLDSGNVTTKDWAYISKIEQKSISEQKQKYGGRRGGTYSYILTTNPSNDTVKDMIGWWSPWAYELLATVDDIRENGEIDEQQSYDKVELKLTNEDKAAGITAIPQELINALQWDKLSIYYDQSTIDAYLYGAPQNGSTPILGSTSRVWRYREVPTLKNIEAVYKDVSDRIIEASRTGKTVPMPWTPGAGALDMLQGGTAGYWHVPKAGLLENKSMSLISFDPEFLGQSPFHRAQSNLYGNGNRKSPTLSGITDPFESMNTFLGSNNASENNNFLSAFNRRISASPFKYGYLNIKKQNGYEYAPALWNDPYMPGDADTSSIWYWWSRNYTPFYKQIAPLVSLGSGMALFDADDTTAWSRGIQRQRLPQLVMRKNVNINTTELYPISTQNSIKSRNLPEIGSYTDNAGKVHKNAVNYVSEYKKAKPIDYGSVTLKGHNSFTFLSPLSVRYYPANLSAISTIKKAFPFLDQSIKIPDSSTHKKLWEIFDRQIESSGINKSPVEWN